MNEEERLLYMPNAVITMKNQSRGGSFYEWDFGDGTTSNEDLIQRILILFPEYIVLTLTVWNDDAVVMMC